MYLFILCVHTNINLFKCANLFIYLHTTLHAYTCSYTLTKAPFNSTRQPGNNFSSFYFFGYIFISVCVTVRACVCVLVCVRCSIPKHSVLAFDANSVSVPQWRRRRVVSFARRRGLCAALRRRRRRHWVDVCGCDAAAAAAAAFVYLFAVRSLFHFHSVPLQQSASRSDCRRVTLFSVLCVYQT